MQPDYPKAVWRPAYSGNYGNRPPGVKIDCVVLHATAGGLSGTFGHFANPTSKVSAHYVVAKKGTVYQMVEESKRAQHAGESVFQGRSDFNDFSIGIEIVNLNDGHDPYPPEQFKATLDLVSYLVAKYQVEPRWIVTHQQISTEGKTDPLGFPMHSLVQRVYLPEDVVRAAAWGAAGIPFNPQAAFAQYAHQHKLGVPQTEEFDFSHQGVSYRGQGFSLAIVYAQVGDWGNIEEIDW